MPNMPSQDHRSQPRASYRGLYQAAIAGGVIGALYVYGVAFDELSEEQLIQLSALWLLPVVFGIYGFVAERLLQLQDEGDDLSIARAALMSTSALPVIGIVLLLPFLFVKHNNPIGLAFLATLVWAVLLFGFFAVIFPLL